MLHKRERRMANWIGHDLCRKYIIKRIIERKTEERIEVTGRRGRRSKQLLNDLKKTRRYWKFKAEVLDGTVWKIGLGRGYGPVVRLHGESWQSNQHAKDRKAIQPIRTMWIRQEALTSAINQTQIPQSLNPQPSHSWKRSFTGLMHFFWDLSA